MGVVFEGRGNLKSYHAVGTAPHVWTKSIIHSCSFNMFSINSCSCAKESDSRGEGVSIIKDMILYVEQILVCHNAFI